MRLKSTSKHKYELHLKVEELNNIPQPTGAAYCKLTVSKHSRTTKFQDYSPHVEIKHNKCHFKYELVRQFSIYQDIKKNLLLELNLTIEFYSLLEHHKTKLGVVRINLVEFLKFNNYQTARYLLQESKINSILKLSIYWVPISIPQTPTSPIRTSFLQTSPRLADEYNFADNIDGLESPVHLNGAIDIVEDPTASGSLNGGNHIENGKLQHKLSNCLGVGNLVISDDRILEMVDKSFQIPWCDEYDEFTPQECVNDIFDNNGPGFKRNDEGLLLVDLYSTKKLNQELGLAHMITHDDEQTISTSEDDDIDEEDDLPSGVNYRQRFRGLYLAKKKNHVLPLVKEKEIRPDLKSWTVS